MASIAKQFGLQISRMKLGQIPFAASQRQELNVQNGIPKDYYIFGFIARLTFRLVIAGGTTSGQVVDSFPAGLVERFEVSGSHKQYGDAVRYLLQGDHTYFLGNIYGKYFHEKNLGGLSVGAATGAAGTYDCAVTYFIPMVPQDIDPVEQLQYLLDAPRWNTLQIYADWGAAASIVVGGDRTLTLTAFGSGVGSPTLLLTRLTVKMQNARYSHAPIPLKTTYKQVGAGSAAEVTTADGFIAQINTGNFLRAITLFTGLRATGGSLATKGDNFKNYLDTVITRAVIKKDDIPIRNFDWVPGQQMNARTKQIPFTWPTGINEVEFCEHNTVRTAFDTRDIALNNLRFELQGDTTGAVDQRIHLIHHELSGVPIFS